MNRFPPNLCCGCFSSYSTDTWYPKHWNPKKVFCDVIASVLYKVELIPVCHTTPHTSVPNYPPSNTTDLDHRSWTSYTTPCNGTVSHGAPIWVIWIFADHTRGNECKQTHHPSSRCVQHFTCVYLHVQTAVDAGDIRIWRIGVILIKWKTQIPPIGAPCWEENGAHSWISGLNMWRVHKDQKC